MTTWTDIADTNLEPGKPTRSVDGLALRDNPIAITEGAPNAPRIEVGAFPAPQAGDVVLVVLDASPTNDPGTYAKTSSFTVFVAGILRIKPALGSTAYKNGVSVGGSIIDVSVVPGDHIYFYRGGSYIHISGSICADRLIFCGA